MQACIFLATYCYGTQENVKYVIEQSAGKIWTGEAAKQDGILEFSMQACLFLAAYYYGTQENFTFVIEQSAGQI